MMRATSPASENYILIVLLLLAQSASKKKTTFEFDISSCFFVSTRDG
jgi:hypothetical protein